MDAYEAYHQVAVLRRQILSKFPVEPMPRTLAEHNRELEFKRYGTYGLVRLLSEHDSVSSSIHTLCERAMRAGLHLKEYVDGKPTFDNNYYVSFRKTYPRIQRLIVRLRVFDALIYSQRHLKKEQPAARSRTQIAKALPTVATKKQKRKARMLVDLPKSERTAIYEVSVGEYEKARDEFGKRVGSDYGADKWAAEKTANWIKKEFRVQANVRALKEAITRRVDRRPMKRGKE